MKYTAKYFRDNLPSWKNKKDPLIAQWVYRPISFYFSAFCANRNISANAVSYFSISIAIIACALFYFPTVSYHIWGAIFVNIWLLFDCIDGNIARGVKKQPFGEFADATSSYILIAFLYTAMGYAVYADGGILFDKGNSWVIVCGAIASTTDMLMRLIHHKYLEGERKLMEQTGYKVVTENINDEKDQSIKGRIKEVMRIGGYLPVAILFATIWNFLDIIVLYCLFLSMGLFLVFTTKTIIKAIKITKDIG